MGYIVLGIGVIFVGVFAGLLARRKRLHKECPYSLKDQGYVMCDGTDLRAWDGYNGSYITEDATGKKWYNKEGQPHRTDGPAMVWQWGTKDWYINGKRHREDGPATEYSDGNKAWHLNGINYRTEEDWKKELDKPTCETDEKGNKRWYKGSKFHREDGPAIEYSNGEKSWYLNGFYQTEEQWKQAVSELARS